MKQAATPPKKKKNVVSAWRLTNGDNHFEKQLDSDSERSSSLNPLDDKSASAPRRGLFTSSADRVPTGESLFNYTRRRLPPLNSPIPLAGSNICGSACHLQFWDTEEGEKNSYWLAQAERGSVFGNGEAVIFPDKNRRGNKWIYRSTSVDPGICHRKSPWWLSQTLVHHHHHHEKKMKKKPFKILLNPTDAICLVLLLLLLRPTSVCPAAVLEIS